MSERHRNKITEREALNEQAPQAMDLRELAAWGLLKVASHERQVPIRRIVTTPEQTNITLMELTKDAVTILRIASQMRDGRTGYFWFALVTQGGSTFPISIMTSAQELDWETARERRYHANVYPPIDQQLRSKAMPIHGVMALFYGVNPASANMELRQIDIMFSGEPENVVGG